MNIPFLGIFFPVEEAIVIVCIIIILYLIVLKFEFKQLSIISTKIDSEETELNKEVEELKEEFKGLNRVIKEKSLSDFDNSTEEKTTVKKEDYLLQ